MAKKNKNKGRGRVRSLLGGAVMLAPAVLAAATAFMNTAVAKDRGLVGNGNGGSNSKRDSDSSSSARKSRKRSKSSKS